MYFNKIKLIGASTIELKTFGASLTDPYIFRHASGLDAPEVDVFIGEVAIEGGFYQGHRPRSRELVFTIGLNPNYSLGQTVASLREDLYSLLGGQAAGILVSLFNDDVEVARIAGHVSKMPTPLFEKSTVAQITVECTSPYLKAPVETIHTEANGLTSASTLNVIEYDGSAPTGIIFDFTTVNAVGSQFRGIKIESNSEVLTFDTMIDSQDRIIINTTPGSRSALSTGPTGNKNLLSSIINGSVWPKLYKGTNEVYVTSYLGNLFSHDWNSISYTKQYWGV